MTLFHSHRTTVYRLITISMVLLYGLMLCGCGNSPTTATPTQVTTATTQAPTQAPTQATTQLDTLPTTPPDTQPQHSALFIPDVTVEDVILYFDEVCLDAEVINSGDPSFLQRWEVPIRFSLNGNYTASDAQLIQTYCEFLNSIAGFPGISQTEDPLSSNLDIYFCTYQEMIDRHGQDAAGTDGYVQFWYDGHNAIYYGTICYVENLPEPVRTSVILEELYNLLGPIQDTSLRSDSIIYRGYSEPQALTEIDQLILKLLYHPSLKTGMNADACHTIIRQLYY